MKKRLLLFVPIALLLALGYWLSQNIERQTRLVNTGPTLAVLLNPWHAAQMFLERHHVTSHRAMDLHDVLPRLQPGDMLILFNDKALHDRHQQQRLMEWMHAGGHLVITANYEWDEEAGSSHDPFLDAMGVRLVRVEYTREEEENDDDVEAVDPLQAFAELMLPPPAPAGDAAAPEEDATAITPACTTAPDTDVFRVAYQDNADLLQIRFGYPYTLEDASETAIRDAGAWPNGLLQYAVGDGRMTVLLDTDIWKNRTIGHFDHAFLLWHLLEGRARVWFVASHGSENLLERLWRTARYLLIGVLVWLLLWGWRHGVRFGPLLPDPAPERRRLLEHIEAGSRFQWQHQQQQAVLQRLRDDIWFHLKRLHGIERAQDEAHAVTRLAQIGQLPPERVHHAMTCPAPVREHQWIELISQLQTIRNTL